LKSANLTIQDRTENFAIRVVRAYVELNKRKYDDAGKVLSKQFLRAGTSITKFPQCRRFKLGLAIRTFRNKSL
jgi:hypothetical protein